MRDQNILIIDNYDSFTYNLVHLIEELSHQKVTVAKNDALSLAQINEYDTLILSPGPGLPAKAGLLCSIIDTYQNSKKIFGVCLGMQAIVEVFGGPLKNLKNVYHGIKEELILTADHSVIFEGIEEPIEVGRYHSWVADRTAIPETLNITAIDKRGEVMAVEHKSKAIYGVQFHPESIMTPKGQDMMTNFLKLERDQ